MLACLVVDDHVDAEQGHSQRLSQWPGQLSDDIVIGWQRHSLDVLSLWRIKYIKSRVLANAAVRKWHNVWWRWGRTEVKSEDDSGLETLWLLKNMAFLSEREAGFWVSLWTLGGSKAQLDAKHSGNFKMNVTVYWFQHLEWKKSKPKPSQSSSLSLITILSVSIFKSI